MRKDFLITGGAGFIGSHTTRFLLNKGYQIRVLDDFSIGFKENLPLDNPGLEVIQGCILDPVDTAAALKDVRFVLHMAAVSSVPSSVNDPLHTHQVNCTGTLQLLIAATHAGVERFVLSSSCSLYGNDTTWPESEICTTTPMSPYALTKKMNEDQCALFQRLHGLPICTLRYFNAYGAGQTVHSHYAAVIPRFCKALLSDRALTLYGDGQQTRDFVHVSDIARANLAACFGPEESIGHSYNIGSGQNISIMALAEKLSDIAGVPGAILIEPARTGEVRHSQADISKAIDVLGWKPSISFSEGLQSTFAWHKQQIKPAEHDSPYV